MKLKISGQIPSGKNAVIITRTGLRFPAKRFVEWRKKAIEEVLPQLSNITEVLPIDHTCNVTIEYRSADMRRRDVPGMIDALWHLLEKVGVVTDDKHLGGHMGTVIFKNFGKDKDNAGVIITIEE